MRMFAAGLLAVLAITAVLWWSGAAQNQAQAQQGTGKTQMLSHMVYFKLKDNSAASKQKMVDASTKYLSKHPGTVFFGVGNLADGYDRPVNDRDWDIALNLVFKDRASHDAYQVAEEHKKFIEENKENWATVRVFDADLAK